MHKCDIMKSYRGNPVQFHIVGLPLKRYTGAQVRKGGLDEETATSSLERGK